MRIPYTWKVITSPKINEMLNEIVSLINDKEWNQYCEFPYPKFRGLFTTSRNLSRLIGQCRSDFRDDSFAILLSPHLLEMNEEVIRRVLIHEIAHAYNPRNHHGYRWQELANKIAKYYGISEITRCETDEKILNQCCQHKERQYEIGCPTCGAIWRYRIMSKAVKRPEKYRCGKCKHQLVRIK